MMDSLASPAVPAKRQRGGQPGNKNRALHGFYSPLYTEDEKTRLEDPASLEDEQKLLRTRVLRLAEQIQQSEEFDQKMMHTLLEMIQTIATLERVKALSRGCGGEIAESVLDALGRLDPYEEL